MNGIVDERKKSSLLEPMINRTKYDDTPHEKQLYLGEWLKEQEKNSKVFKKGKFITSQGQTAKLVVIYAGTGAGKTYFVTKTLPNFGNVYFNCSRTMIVTQQNASAKKNKKKKDKFEPFSATNKLIISTSWGLKSTPLFKEALKADYIVVDEAHHICSDSFADATTYIYDLLSRVTNQTVILLTACKRYFETTITAPNGGGFFDLHVKPVLFLDLLNTCYYQYPTEFYVVTDDYISRHNLLASYSSSNILYFCKSARSAYHLACRASLTGKNAVAITSQGKLLEPIANKYVVDVLNNARGKSTYLDKIGIKIANHEQTTNLLLNIPDLTKQVTKSIEKGRFPKDVDIIYATSRMREGIDIKESDKGIIMFIETLDAVNIVQTIGRIRFTKGHEYKLKKVYFVIKKQHEADLSLLPDHIAAKKINERFDDTRLRENEKAVSEFLYNQYDEIDFSKNGRLAKKERPFKFVSSLSKFPGQWVPSPIRDENHEIDLYKIRANDLWFINAYTENSLSHLYNPVDLRHIDNFVNEINCIFPHATLNVLSDPEDLQEGTTTSKKHLNSDTGTRKNLMSVIEKYAEKSSINYLSKADIENLKNEIKDVGKFSEEFYLSVLLKKYGFEGVWRNSKREQYKIVNQKVKIKIALNDESN